MEENKTKIFWKSIDGGELKELECVAESGGFDFKPLEEPIDVKYDQTPIARSFIPNRVKQYKKIAGKRYRLPRKVKKRFKTNMCKRCGIKKLKFSYKQLNMDMVK